MNRVYIFEDDKQYLLKAMCPHCYLQFDDTQKKYKFVRQCSLTFGICKSRCYDLQACVEGEKLYKEKPLYMRTVTCGDIVCVALHKNNGSVNVGGKVIKITPENITLDMSVEYNSYIKEITYADILNITKIGRSL